jgi:hypothetical protein
MWDRWQQQSDRGRKPRPMGVLAEVPTLAQ